MMSIWKSPEGERAVVAEYERVAARWPVPLERLTVKTRLGSTAVLAWGEPAAPAVVFLHGSVSNATSWVGEAARFAGYRAYAPDMPGDAGRSEAVRAPLDGEVYIEWLDDVLGALGVDRPALVGISLGGWLALRWTAARPERTRGLVMLCPSGLAPGRVSFLVKAMLLAPFGKAGSRAMVRMAFGNEPVDPEAIRITALMGAHFRPRMEALPLVPDDEIRRLSMPVLFIGGDKDALVRTKEGASRLARLVPGADVRVLPGRGHAIVDQGDVILGFLDAIDR